MTVWLRFHIADPGTAFRMSNADPEIAYLTNSLAALNGQAYVMVQHPGTPMLVAGTAVLAATMPFISGSRETFAQRVIDEPELFFVPAHVLLLVFNLGCIVALGWQSLPIRGARDALLATAVAVSFFAFLPRAFAWSFYWSHNAVAFPAGTWVLLALLVALRGGNRALSTRTGLTLGISAGLLAATQLYFATWAIGIVATLTCFAYLSGAAARTAASAVLATIIGAIGAFVVACIPAIPEWRVFARFISGVVTHQGAYGSGPRGLVDWAQQWSNMKLLWSYAPLLFLAVVGVGLLLVVALATRERSHPRDPGVRAVVVGLAIQFVITLLVLTRHPSVFYVPALAAMLPPMLAVAFDLGNGSNRSWRLLSTSLAVLILCCFVGTAFETDRHFSRRGNFRTAMEGEVRGMRERYAADRNADVLVLWGPGVEDAGCYARWMGVQYTNNALAGHVSRACPSEGLAWSTAVVVPEAWKHREDAQALIVTSETALGFFSSLGAGDGVSYGVVRDEGGARLAYIPVILDRARIRGHAPGATATVTAPWGR